MSVTLSDVRAVREDYEPTLKAVARGHRSSKVDAVTVQVVGRRGGESGWWMWGPQARQTFHILLDVSNIKTKIPPAWILKPSDPKIRHLNVFHFGYCPVVNRNLPEICWGEFAHKWMEVPKAQRTLGGVIGYLRQLMNHQNPDSPAR